jgi:CheY-like chemotaxis protein
MHHNDTLGRLVGMLARLIGEHIHLEWRPDLAARPVRIDPSQVDQLLTNLCVNARDAIDGVGQIIISTADVFFEAAHCAVNPDCQPGRYTRISVHDDGCGMDADTLARVFEPFFSTKGLGEGTGLGLSIVYGVVRQNGGFVQVDSAPGMGKEFRLFLPVDPGEVQASKPGVSPIEPAGGHETVLLVEDEPAVLRFARRVLQDAGYAVLVAASPSEGLRLASEHPGPLHALVTDVIMPDMNGVVLAERVRQAHPEVRSVFMSGYAEDIISRQGALEPGVRFLQKPFTLQDLKRTLREALDG